MGAFVLPTCLPTATEQRLLGLTSEKFVKIVRSILDMGCHNRDLVGASDRQQPALGEA